MNTIIEKIIAEVERLYNDKSYSEDRWDMGYDCACEDIMSFLSTLESEKPTLQEQPVKVGDKVSIIKKKEGIVTRISDGKARVETGDTMEIVNLSDLVTEQPVKPSVEDAMKELDKKIAKATKSWKGVDVDKMLAECRGYDEQPVCEGLEEEITEFIANNYEVDYYDGLKHHGEYLDTYDVEDIARHFAQWQKEQMMKDGNVILSEED